MNHLPTPPHTLARHNTVDKENIPPLLSSSKTPSSPTPLQRKTVFPPSPKSTPHPQSKLQLRVPRVVFSQNNRHHPYAHQPKALPSSRMVKPPRKSILKSTSAVFPSIPPATAPREPTPEPEKPLETVDFLVTPIKRLLSSLEADVPGQLIPVSQHDLTEAYVTLGARLRTHFKSASTDSIPALAPLQANSEELARVFVRDLSKASQEPPVLTSSDEESLFDTEASSSDAETPRKKGVSAEQITYARDAFILTQSSIRTIAVILSTKPIYSVFSEVSLTCITSALLSILLAPKLYLPNSRKTTMLAMWAVQNIRLPASVVAPLADRFLEAIQRGIDGQLGKEGKKGAGCEALNAVHTLCRLYPSVFIPYMSALLPAILQRCVPATQPATSANSNNICLRASAALGGIALGVLNWSRVEPHDPDLKEAQIALTDCMMSFFAEPNGNVTPSKKKTPKKVPADSQAQAAPLVDAILYAIGATGDEGVDATSNPAWAISLLTALGVLFRESLFASPLGIGLFLECLTKAGGKDAKPQAKLLLRMWWPAVVWAAGMLDQVEEARLLAEGGKAKSRKSVWSQSIWHIKFMGVATLATLLNADAESDEDREARISVGMAWMRYAIKDNQAPAIHILSQLVNTCRLATGDWNPDVVIARQLVDGAIVTQDWKTVSAFAKDVMENKVLALVLDGELREEEELYGVPGVEDLRPLEQKEVQVWFEPLMACWRDIVGRVSFGRGAVGEDGVLGKAPGVVLTIWERLIGAQVDFLQDPESDPEAVASVVELIASALTTFILPHSEYPRSMEGSDQDRSIAALFFARKLWDICKEAFGTFPTGSALEAIPAAVVAMLRNPQDISVCDFREDPTTAQLFEHWSSFLVDVLRAGPMSVLRRVCEDIMWEDEPSRVLWALVAQLFIGEGAEGEEEWWCVEDGTCVLGVPFTEVGEEDVVIDASAMRVWEDLLDRVVERAASLGEGDAVLQSVAAMVNNCTVLDNATSLRVTAALVQRIEFPQHASAYAPSAEKPEPEFDAEVLGSDLNFILAVVNTVLARVTPGKLRTVQEVDAGHMVLGAMQPVLASIPAALSVVVLAALQRGLGAWFRDTVGSAFVEDVYNDKIVTLYISALARLQRAAPSARVLHALQDFFASVFVNPPAPAKGPLGFQRFWMDNYQQLDAAALQPYPEVLKPILRSLMNVSAQIEAPGLSYGSDPSLGLEGSIPEVALESSIPGVFDAPVAFASPSVFDDESQSQCTQPDVDDSGYLADGSNFAPFAPVATTFETQTDLDGESFSLAPASLMASPVRPAAAMAVPPSPSLAQLLEQAASQRSPQASQQSPPSSDDDGGASETEVSDAPPAVKEVVEVEVFEQFVVDFEKEGALADVGFVQESASQDEGSSDDSSAGREESPVVQARSPSPLPAPEADTSVVPATPDCYSDDLEVLPDSQEEVLSIDEEDEADARAVENSLELTQPPTPISAPAEDPSKSSLKRSVGGLMSSPHKRARLDDADESPIKSNNTGRLPSLFGERTNLESPSVISPTPGASSQEVLAAATPSPALPLRKRVFLEAVEVPSVASLRRRWQKSASTSNAKPAIKVQPLEVSNDVFGTGQSSPSQPEQKAPSLLGRLPSLFGRVAQRSSSFAGTPTKDSPKFDEHIRSDDTEAGVAEARRAMATSAPGSDDMPSSFEGVIGSSGLKRQRSSEDRNDIDENDTPTRRKLSRTVSVPVAKHAEAAFHRTHSLSVEVERSLQQIVGAPAQQNINDLKSLSAVLSRFQEEVGAAIVQKQEINDGDN